MTTHHWILLAVAVLAVVSALIERRLERRLRRDAPPLPRLNLGQVAYWMTSANFQPGSQRLIWALRALHLAIVGLLLSAVLL